MVRPPSRNRALLLAIGCFLLPMTVSAHTVKASKTVAVTYHLEPDHNPRAGEPAQVWFVLTQKRGVIIPLDQCDCQLQVYSEQNPAVLLQPTLAAVSAEQYQGIPGADVTFPQPGAYRLVFQGRPQNGDLFEPFQFNFPVTVTKGASPAPPETLPSTPKQSAPPSNVPKLVWTGMGILGISIALGLGLVVLGRWQRQR